MRRCTAFFAVLLVCVAGAGSPAATELDVAAIERLIAETMAQDGAVGLSAAVMHEGQVVLAKGYGVRSIESGAAVTAETLFAIGSVSKQFTCATVALLESRAKLSFDDPVEKFIPGLTRGADITLLDAGQHVSGYRDYYPLDFVTREMQRPTTAAAVVDEYAGAPLDFEPGARWSYSNTGYLILGEAAERAAGVPFSQLLDEAIFTPLGLAHTRYEPELDDPDLANGYTPFALGPPQPDTPEGRGWVGAAGGIWSTAGDLMAWDLALIDGTLLGPDAYTRLVTPRRLADGRSSRYGCGLSIDDNGAALVLSHGGAVRGFLARNSFVPATRSAVALLVNTGSFGEPLSELNRKILDMLMPPPPDVPAVSGPPALEVATAFVHALRAGRIDRSHLGEEFDAFMTDEHVRAASTSLKRLGKPTRFVAAPSRERGGMEVTVVRFQLGRKPARALLYRTPDGKIQQLLILDGA